MKKIAFVSLLCAVAMTAFSSCSKETVKIDPATPISGGMKFTANISPVKGDETKTTMSADGKLTWNMSDSISVNGVIFKVAELTEDSTGAVFVKVGTTPDPVAPFIACYPARIYDGKNFVLPSVQKYGAEGNLSGVNPMYAESDTSTILNFKNLCSLLQFSVTGTEKITSIRLHAGNGSLCGTFSVVADRAGYKAVIEEGNPFLTLDIEGGIQLGIFPASVCVAVPAGRYEDLSVQFISDKSKTKTLLIDSDFTVDRGMKYQVKKKVVFTFKDDDEALRELDACYAMMYGSEYCPDWPLKAATLIGNGPTMDIQFTGEDAAFNTQSVTPSNEFLQQAWFHCYKAINLCNGFLTSLEESESSISPVVSTILKGEALALRGFFYSWLAQTFGQVPILNEGEVFTDNTGKAKATYADLWNYIIDDFGVAKGNLDWNPFNNEYGRATKGMALTYLCDAYMWKAYRIPAEASGCYNNAKSYLKQVIDSEIYKLNQSFTTLWDPDAVKAEGIKFDKEYIWASVFDPNGLVSNSAKAYRFSNDICDQVSYPRDGNCSWEWYAAYEKGDKRRDGSCCTDNISDKLVVEYSIEPSAYVKGKNPFVKVEIPDTTFHYKNGSSQLPSIWNMKLWKSASGSDGRMVTVPFFWKNYSNILIDYAECCFRTSDEATGWARLDEVRNRAFGNLETGYAETLKGRYMSYYLRAGYLTLNDDYPVPFSYESVPVSAAQEYYTMRKSQKGYQSDKWLVALNEERRKEFAGEWSLFPDMVRSGFMEDHITTNYNVTALPAEKTHENYPWTVRTFTFNADKLVMPIPQYEIDHNALMEQNPGY